jgi:D-alanyl-D-alanine carboxypeptidase/D-alanyl-D-alanine-endopeptidase (penicillin-binding protein 4)
VPLATARKVSRVSTATRSKFAVVLQSILLLSGWAVAVALGLRVWKLSVPSEKAPVDPPVIVSDPAQKLDAAFREWLANPKLAGAPVGFCVLDENGETIFASPLAEVALCPASALKTVTTGAALGLLGPEFRFETVLAATSPLKADGTVDGDLVLVGAGDPTLSSDDVIHLADTAIVAGLKNVTGRIVIDASIFPSDPVSGFWNWGDIGNAYGAGAFGLNVDHNRLTIRFNPGPEPGALATFLGGAPAPRDTRWESHVVTGAAGSGDQVVVYSAPYSRSIVLRGSVPLGESGFSIGGAIPDPPALAAELLRARLESAGVKFAERTISAESRMPLARHQSPPLAEIIDHLHRVSDNIEAQCLFLTISRKQNADPADAVRQYWERAGVSFAGLRLLDGSGLARANMIRPLDLARVNLAARRGPHGQRFYESLTSTLDGAVRSKNGAMSGVRSEVGFLRTAAERELTFAFIANGLHAGIEFWPLRQELLRAIREADAPVP